MSMTMALGLLVIAFAIYAGLRIPVDDTANDQGASRISTIPNFIACVSLMLIAIGPVVVATGPRWMEPEAAAPKDGDLRIVLRSVRAELDPKFPLTIGGDREVDGIYVPGVSKNLITIRPTNVQGVAEMLVRLPMFSSDVEQEFGVVGIEPLGRNFSFFSPAWKLVGAQELQGGEKIWLDERGACVLIAPAATENSFTDHIQNLSKLRAMPVRANSFIDWGPDIRIYSARSYVYPADRKDSLSAQCERAVDPGRSQGLPFGFLYKRKGLKGAPYFGVALHQGVIGPTEGFERIEFGPKSGYSEFRVRIYSVAYDDLAADRDQKTEVWERINERRSFLIRYLESPDGGSPKVEISYDTPEYHRISSNGITRVFQDKYENILETKQEGEIEPNERITFVFGGTANQLAPENLAEANIILRSVGHSSGRAMGRIQLPLTLRGTKFDFGGGIQVPSDGLRDQTKTVNFGEAFWLGGKLQARIELHQLRASGKLPLYGYVLLVAFGCIGAAFLFSNLSRKNVEAWAIFVAVQTMLALRLVISLSGEYLYPKAWYEDIAGSALFVFLVVPLILRSFVRETESWWLIVQYGLFCLVAYVWIQETMGVDFTARTLGGMAAGLATWSVLSPLVGKVVAKPIFVEGPSGLATRVAMFFSGDGSFLRKDGLSNRTSKEQNDTAVPLEQQELVDVRPPAKLHWAAWAGVVFFVLVVLRVAFGAIGWKEGINLGVRISTAILFLPIGLLTMNWLSQNLAVRRTLGGLVVTEMNKPVYSFTYLLALVLVFAVASVGVNDIGYATLAIGLAWFAFMLFLTDTELKRIDLIAAVLAALSFVCMFWMGLSLVLDQVEWQEMIFLLVPYAAMVLFVLIADIRGVMDEWTKANSLKFWIVAAGIFALSLVCALYTFQNVLVPVVAAMLFGAALLLSRRAIWTFAFSGVLALMLAFHFPADGPLQAPIAKNSAKGDSLEKRVSFDGNVLRLWYHANPDPKGSVGTLSSEQLLAAFAHMGDYTQCPADDSLCLAGRGFLGVPPPTELEDFQLWDNVSAVHLIAPFGRLAALGLIAVLGVLGWQITKRQLQVSSGTATLMRPSRALAVTTLWTVFGMAVYMILANLRIVPFTGKNIYFLSSLSGSDAIEGLLLMVMAMICLQSSGDSSLRTPPLSGGKNE